MIRALAYDLMKDQKKGEVLNRSASSPYIHEYFQVITKYVLFQVSRINSFLNNLKGEVIKKVVVEYSRAARFILDRSQDLLLYLKIFFVINLAIIHWS